MLFVLDPGSLEIFLNSLVRLHTRKLTRRPRTVDLLDNDKGASPDLRKQIAYM